MGYLTQTTGMGTWKARQLPKKTRGKQESGRSKGLVPPAWAKNICRKNRSYKSADYDKWCAICTGDKIQWSKK